MSTDKTTPAAGIVLSDVRFSFGRVKALDGVDLEIDRGSIMSLFGPNGSGKTTLMRILSGLLRPAHGSVRVLGESALEEPRFRRRIGFVGHETFVYGDMSPNENLRYYSRLYGRSDESRIRMLIDTLGLDNVADRPVRGLSRGLMQRLSLGRALLHEPELLLLDEPFTGLDPQGASVLSESLSAFRAGGRTIVLSTHDLERGTAIADKAVVLHRGRVVWASQGRMPAASEMAVVYDKATRAAGRTN